MKYMTFNSSCSYAGLANHMDMSLLKSAMTKYMRLIAAEMETICP